ncbi:hypothetical protein Hanom_Chr13g01202341 [Helianthus anomalus]
MNGDSVVLYQRICWQIAGNLFAVCELIIFPLSLSLQVKLMISPYVYILISA